MTPILRDTCTWQENLDGDWETTCNAVWCLIDGTPSDNNMQFCPVCGGALREITYATATSNDNTDGATPCATFSPASQPRNTYLRFLDQ